MPTRQLRDEPPPTVPPAAPSPDASSDVSPAASREPVLLGDVLFHTLAEIARRAPAPSLPAQRTRPHP
ncbi:hypothetical protein P3T27_000467 [Kitasatospora sp. MAA19]|uniref:hypothetical protein n=1 Tax=unclassified Kitasatospora TaxID=2633591 RepID=UPI0024749969|nr:hypothetical protein [Kitasatospora sp. MAA19]MDH6703786.1 hypothetical protein [Kitasatospora sp. MAA19]